MIGSYLLDGILHGKGDNRRSLGPCRLHNLFHHMPCEKRTHRIMYQHHIDIVMDRLKRMPDRILPFASSRHHFSDLGKAMLRHDLFETIVHLVLRNSQDDFLDDGRSLEHMKRMEDERLTAECKELFGHRAAHAKASSGGRDKSHGVVIHNWSLDYPYSSREAYEQMVPAQPRHQHPILITSACPHGRSVR